MLSRIKRGVKSVARGASERLGLATSAQRAWAASRLDAFAPASRRYSAGIAIGTPLFRQRTASIPALGVQLFDRAELRGDQGRVRDARGRWVLDFGHPSPRELFAADEPQVVAGLTVQLCNPVVARNYYHFLLDCLPRYRVCLEAGIEGERIFAPCNEPFQREAFGLLGLTDRLVPAAPGSRLKCEKLAVPDGLVRNEPVRTPEFTWAQVSYQLDWAIEYLDSELRARNAESISQQHASAQPRRIYVSREQARNRKVLNEAELVEALEQLGVTRVFTEKMSLAEQMSLFHGAELIVAPHGAGLANLVFSRRGSTVVELVPRAAPLSFFWMLAETRGLEYSYIACESVFNGDRKRFPAYDCQVDVKRLVSYLRERFA